MSSAAPHRDDYYRGGGDHDAGTRPVSGDAELSPRHAHQQQQQQRHLHQQHQQQQHVLHHHSRLSQQGVAIDEAGVVESGVYHHDMDRMRAALHHQGGGDRPLPQGLYGDQQQQQHQQQQRQHQHDARRQGGYGSAGDGREGVPAGINPAMMLSFGEDGARDAAAAGAPVVGAAAARAIKSVPGGRARLMVSVGRRGEGRDRSRTPSPRSISSSAPSHHDLAGVPGAPRSPAAGHHPSREGARAAGGSGDGVGDGERYLLPPSAIGHDERDAARMAADGRGRWRAGERDIERHADGDDYSSSSRNRRDHRGPSPSSGGGHHEGGVAEESLPPGVRGDELSASRRRRHGVDVTGPSAAGAHSASGVRSRSPLPSAREITGSDMYAHEDPMSLTIRLPGRGPTSGSASAGRGYVDDEEVVSHPGGVRGASPEGAKRGAKRPRMREEPDGSSDAPPVRPGSRGAMNRSSPADVTQLERGGGFGRGRSVDDV